MKKVILVDINRKPYIPEECLYTASMIKDSVGIENVYIVKMGCENDVELLDTSIGFDPAKDERVILVWLYDYFPADTQINILDRLVKDYAGRDDTTFCLSGGHPSLAPTLFLESGDFDYVIAGWPWAAPFKWLAGKPDKPEIIIASAADGIPDGATLWDAFDRIVNPAQCVWRDYGTQFVSFTFTRMCKYNCQFCMCTNFQRNFGGEVVKSQNRVMAELKFLQQKFDLTCITLTDFRNTVDQIRTISDFGLTLVDQLDVCVKDLDEDFVDALKAAGVECVFFGLESIRPDVQRKISKRYDLQRFSDILDYALQSGLMFEGNQMIGLSAVIDDPLDLPDLAREVNTMAQYWERHPNLRVMLRPYMPFLGTPLGDRLWGTRLDHMAWKGYLTLVYTVTSGLALTNAQPLPPVYANAAVYDEIGRCCADFKAMNRHLTSLILCPPKNRHKQEVCRTLTDHGFASLKKAQFGFGGFLESMLSAIAHWR